MPPTTRAQAKKQASSPQAGSATPVSAESTPVPKNALKSGLHLSSSLSPLIGEVEKSATPIPKDVAPRFSPSVSDFDTPTPPVSQARKNVAPRFSPSVSDFETRSPPVSQAQAKKRAVSIIPHPDVVIISDSDSSLDGSEFQPEEPAALEEEVIRENDEVAQLSGREFLLLRPYSWGQAWDDIETLDAKAWLGGSLMSFYCLSTLPLAMEDCLTLFIPLENILEIQRRIQLRQPVTAEDQAAFRKVYNMQPNERIPKRPVTAIILQRDHYFVAVFDTIRKSVWVFGRRNLAVEDDNMSQEELERSDEIAYEEDEWDQWNGPGFWRAVHELMGWDAPSTRSVNKVGVCWFWNGRDCGPDSIFIFETLVLKQGLTWYQEDMPSLPDRPCGHSLRLAMLGTVLQKIIEVYQRWFIISSRQATLPEALKAVEAIVGPWIEQLSKEPENSDVIRRVYKSLLQAPKDCPRCKALGQKKTRNLTSEDIDRFKHTIDPANPNLPSEDEEEEPIEIYVERQLVLRHPNERYYSVRAIARRERHVEAPILPPQRFVPLMFDPSFDDYNEGPTIEELLDVPLHVQNYPRNPYGQWDDLSEWTLFKDYGYRLDRSFALAFNDEQPIAIAEHFLPISPTTGYENIAKKYEIYSLKRKGDKSQSTREVEVKDIRIMGAAEMLEEAGDIGSDASYEVFLQGRDNNGKFINTDLERDSRPPKRILISYDIDSLIWITPYLRFLKATKIHMLPYMRDRPPLDIHNHMYVNVHIPQTDEERAGSKFTQLQRFKLSSIPHTHFGQIGEGSGSGNIYVFFPRMIHRQQKSPFWDVKMPYLVQSLWFSKVVQPAVIKVAGIGRMEYLDFSQSEWKKQGNTRTIPLLSNQLFLFQREIHRIITEDKDQDDLHIFGSYFFVFDIRGIKLITKSGMKDEYEGPLEALEKEFPFLDLHYMMDRENGECVVDLGVSFSPDDKTPLVGLWKLPHVDASFAMGGTNAPKIHAANTLGNYGSLQAEYPRDRGAAVHFTFRQAYNLYYEVIRRSLKFCEDKDAYKGGYIYRRSVKSLTESYESAKQRSFGVREEIRVSLRGARVLWDVVQQKVENYISSPNVLWIRSKTWFSFCLARLQVIERYQLLLVRRRIRNLGNMTLVLMFLLRSIFTTPTMIPSILREFLYDLQFEGVKEKFGMFFLHTLDKDRGTVEGIPSEDSEDVKKLLFVHQQKKKQSGGDENDRIDRRDGSRSNETETDFPAGDMPSWTELENAIRNRAVEMIRAPIWKAELGSNVFASEIFIRFTRDYWLTIRDTFLVGGYPDPKTLQEAITVWSIEEVESRMANVTFQAVRAYWSGLPKGRQESMFEERIQVFFPLPTTKQNTDSNWEALWVAGYIHNYHEIYERLNTDGKMRLAIALKRLLGQVQCLPDAANSTEATRGYLWSYNDTKDGINMDANPRYYKIRGIGKGKTVKRVGPITGSQREIARRLQIENEGITLAELQNQERERHRKENERYRQERRTGKFKNKRIPPKKHK